MAADARAGGVESVGSGRGGHHAVRVQDALAGGAAVEFGVSVGGLVPVLLGGGVRFFDELADTPVRLTGPLSITEGERESRTCATASADGGAICPFVRSRGTLEPWNEPLISS